MVVASAPALAPVQTRVIKTGSVELEVPRGRFGQTVTSLTSLATGLGGYISESKTFETASVPNGTITLRVPASSFEALLGQVRAKGKVKSATSGGQDVTGQYTDLQARLTALSAERDQLLTILRSARSVPDILSVQDRVTGVQSQIEQLQGQLKVLDDQSSFGTLAVSVAEPGAPPPVTPVSTHRRGIKKAWHEAVDGFVGGAEAVLAHSGAVLLVLVFVAAIAVAIRFLWSWSRHRIV